VNRIVPEFYSPDEAAERLHISRASLVALLKSGGHAFTSLTPGARPWGKGHRWGLTGEQLADLLERRARAFPSPQSIPVAEAARPAPPKAIPGHDGRSRLKIAGRGRAG